MAIRLTREQEMAAAYGEGTRSIVATAGSGKTTTLSFRIKKLLEREKVRGRDILATTFTNAGARDFKSRIDTICNRKTLLISLMKSGASVECGLADKSACHSTIWFS